MGLILFILGLFVGSFLNVVIARAVTREGNFFARSHCMHCKHSLGILDLIPLLSFLFLMGRCRFCKERISWQYPLVEFATGLLFVMVYFQYNDLSTLWYAKRFLGIEQDFFQGWILFPLRDLFFLCILLAIFVIDFRYSLIPDSIVLPAILSVFAFQIVLEQKMLPLLIVGFVLFAFFLGQFLLSHGQWIGGGDMRLGFLIGIMFGWPSALSVLLGAYILGAVVSVLLLLFKKKGWKSEIPFGPFLAGVGMYVILFPSIESSFSRLLFP